MANHPQALKRARQSEKRRQRNMHYKTQLRTRVKYVRYAVGQIETLAAGKTIHAQEVEKHLKGIVEGKAADYKGAGFEGLIKSATALLKKYDKKKHAAFLKTLAQADLKISARLLSRAGSKGVLHKRTAGRRISRLTKLVNRVSA